MASPTLCSNFKKNPSSWQQCKSQEQHGFTKGKAYSQEAWRERHIYKPKEECVYGECEATSICNEGWAEE